MSLERDVGLIFFFGKQPFLLQVLAGDTKTGPGHRVEAFLRQRITAVSTFSVLSLLNPFQRLVNQIQQLTIIVRHRHQQFFCIGIGCHVGRILGRFGVAFTAVSFRCLHLAHKAYAPLEQSVSIRFCFSLIHF